MAKTPLELTVDLVVARLNRIPMQASEITAMLDTLYPHLRRLHDEDRQAELESSGSVEQAGAADGDSS